MARPRGRYNVYDKDFDLVAENVELNDVSMLLSIPIRTLFKHASDPEHVFKKEFHLERIEEEYVGHNIPDDMWMRWDEVTIKLSKKWDNASEERKKKALEELRAEWRKRN